MGTKKTLPLTLFKAIGASVLALSLAFCGCSDKKARSSGGSKSDGGSSGTPTRAAFKPMAREDAQLVLCVNLDKKQAFRIVDAYANLVIETMKADEKNNDRRIAEKKEAIAAFKEDPFSEAPEGMRRFLERSGVRSAELRWAVLSVENFEIVDDKPQLGGISLAVAGKIDLNEAILALRQEFDGEVVFEETRIEGASAWHVIPLKDKAIGEMEEMHVDLHVTSLDGRLVLAATSRETLARQILLYRGGKGAGTAVDGFSAAEGELMYLHLSDIGGLVRKYVPRRNLQEVNQIVPNGDELIFGLGDLDIDVNVLPGGMVRDSFRIDTASRADAENLRSLVKTVIRFWRVQFLNDEPKSEDFVKRFCGEVQVGGTGREVKVQSGFLMLGMVAGALFPSIPSAIGDTMASQGRKIIMGIVQANIDRQGKLGPVWPRTQVDGEKSDDIATHVSRSATDYFNDLFDLEHYGTVDWDPNVDGELLSALSGAGVPGMTGKRLTDRNVAWCIAANVTDETPDFMPVLISANFNPAMLLNKWDGRTNGSETLPIGTWSGADKSMLNDKAVVIVRKSGVAEVIKQRFLTYDSLYNRQAFDLTGMNPPLKYLTPTGVVTPGAVDKPPVPRGRIKPEYPKGARERGEEGDVTLEFDISGKGVVDHVRIIKSCGFAELEQAAIKAVKNARFMPARRGSANVPSTARLTLNFRLKEVLPSLKNSKLTVAPRGEKG